MTIIIVTRRNYNDCNSSKTFEIDLSNFQLEYNKVVHINNYWSYNSVEFIKS